MVIRVVKEFFKERKRRLHSPDFQREIAAEKKEFQKSLDRAVDATLDVVYTGILKKIIIDGVSSTAKLAFNKKYKIDLFLKERTKAVLSTTGLAVKAVLAVAKATGRLAKLGIRQFIAK